MLRIIFHVCYIGFYASFPEHFGCEGSSYFLNGFWEAMLAIRGWLVVWCFRSKSWKFNLLFSSCRRISAWFVKWFGK